MALIIIRGENQTKILNSLADVERYAKLKIQGKPRLLDPKKADKYAQAIIGTPLRTKSKIAVLVSVQQDSTSSIVQISNIHPPAHLMVISEEYQQWKEMKKIFGTLPPLKGFYSSKIKKNKKLT
jgi:uncharacterized protein